MDLSDARHGYKNLMGHLKKSPGSSLSVMARKDGSLTSDRSEILKEFADTWQQIYTRLKDNPPSFKDFLFFPSDACRDRLLSYIHKAAVSVEVAIFSLTDDRICEALVSAHRRGVRVRVISVTRRL